MIKIWVGLLSGWADNEPACMFCPFFICSSPVILSPLSFTFLASLLPFFPSSPYSQLIFSFPSFFLFCDFSLLLFSLIYHPFSPLILSFLLSFLFSLHFFFLFISLLSSILTVLSFCPLFFYFLFHSALYFSVLFSFSFFSF